jgi:dTDP-4-amino-4,6-dideoxygalactose transaminase
MHQMIKLFQTDRVWSHIRDQVFDFTDRYHRMGIAQNGEPMLMLEDILAKRFGRKYCVLTGCCTDALIISLLALGLKPNARVAVSNYTFTATAHAVARAGYQVVPVDVVDNYCINTDLISDVDAVIPVDVFGNMSDWNHLNQLTIPVINDAAQSFESCNSLGWSASQGLVSCVSFSPSKTISSWGSGGAVLTDDEAMATRCRYLRLHGKAKNSDLSIGPGVNSMMSSFEVAAVMVGLDHAESWHQRRKKIADYLVTHSRYQPGTDNSIDNSYHKLVFRTDHRKSVQDRFQQANVDCQVHYNLTINDETLYHQAAKSFPVSDRLKTTSFTVPNQHTLTDSEVEYIGELLK